MAQRSANALISVTIGKPDHEERQIGLTLKDVWNLRNGYMVLRDGLLVIPDGEKLLFLIASTAAEVQSTLIGILDASILVKPGPSGPTAH